MRRDPGPAFNASNKLPHISLSLSCNNLTQRPFGGSISKISSLTLYSIIRSFSLWKTNSGKPKKGVQFFFSFLSKFDLNAPEEILKEIERMIFNIIYIYFFISKAKMIIIQTLWSAVQLSCDIGRSKEKPPQGC